MSGGRTIRWTRSETLLEWMNHNRRCHALTIERTFHWYTISDRLALISFDLTYLISYCYIKLHVLSCFFKQQRKISSLCLRGNRVGHISASSYVYLSICSVPTNAVGMLLLSGIRNSSTICFEYRVLKSRCRNVRCHYVETIYRLSDAFKKIFVHIHIKDLHWLLLLRKTKIPFAVLFWPHKVTRGNIGIKDSIEVR